MYNIKEMKIIRPNQLHKLLSQIGNKLWRLRIEIFYYFYCKIRVNFRSFV